MSWLLESGNPVSYISVYRNQTGTAQSTVAACGIDGCCFVDNSARQKIDADLVHLDVQIRLLDGKSITDRVTSSEDATGPDLSPTAPMVSSCVKKL